MGAQRSIGELCFSWSHALEMCWGEKYLPVKQSGCLRALWLLSHCSHYYTCMCEDTDSLGTSALSCPRPFSPCQSRKEVTSHMILPSLPSTQLLGPPPSGLNCSKGLSEPVVCCAPIDALLPENLEVFSLPSLFSCILRWNVYSEEQNC